MISGKTTLIAHLGYPTESFKAPMIYNPWFDKQGIDAVVVPMGVKPEEYPEFVKLLFRMTNIRGALVTMPHKVTTVGLMDEVTPTVRVAGSCNAILLRPDGSLLGDMFDGAGFVRGVQRKGCNLKNARVLVSGCGGVGCAIAASLAAADIAEIGVSDASAASAEALAGRLRENYPKITVTTGSNDPAGYDVVVTRIAPTTFVGEVVMKQEMTPLLAAAKAKGCAYQVGTDMLFEQIPAYLEFFGFGTTTAEELREVAKIKY